MTLELTLELVVLDVNETLSDLSLLRKRFTDSGAPAHLLETWFAATLCDGFALAATARTSSARTCRPSRASCSAGRRST